MNTTKEKNSTNLDKAFETVLADTKAEEAVLSALMNFPSLVPDAQGQLSEDTFTDNKLKNIWRLVADCIKNGDKPDLITLNGCLAKNAEIQQYLTIGDLMDVNSSCVSSANFPTWLARLKELEKRRACKMAGYKVLSLAVDETQSVEEVLNKTVEIINNLNSNGKEYIISLSEGLFTFTDSLQNRKLGLSPIGTKTGFPEWDSRGGLTSGSLVVVAADTSMGKSSLALTIAKNAIFAGDGVAYYSLEMPSIELITRLAAMQSRVSLTSLMNGRMSDRDEELENAAVNDLYGKPLYFDDAATSNLDNILASIRRMRVKYGIKGAVVDYLQILNVNSRGKESREQFMGDVARRLKNLARELGIWIIALSQLNRDRENPEPSLSRLRDSGQIAEAADNVILLYRPERYERKYPKPFQDKETHGTALLDVAKGRNTGTFRFLCGFAEENTLFYPKDVQTATSTNEPF